MARHFSRMVLVVAVALAAGACSSTPSGPGADLGNGSPAAEPGASEPDAEQACLAIDEARDAIVGGLFNLSVNAVETELFTDDEVSAQAAELVQTLRSSAQTLAGAASLAGDTDLAEAIEGLAAASNAHADGLEAAGDDRDAIIASLSNNEAFEEADAVIRPICFDIWNPEFGAD